MFLLGDWRIMAKVKHLSEKTYMVDKKAMDIDAKII